MEVLYIIQLFVYLQSDTKGTISNPPHDHSGLK